MVTRVDKFLGGLGIDATNKFEVQANATVTVGDGTSTGNVNVGGEVVSSTIDATTLKIGGTAVSATATELNYVDGVTSAIQTQIDGKLSLTGGTVSGATTFQNTVNISGGSAVLQIGGASITASAAELNLLDGLTGTVWTSDNDGAGSGLDADTLDGVTSASLLRSDATDSASGALTFSGGLTMTSALTLNAQNDLRFADADSSNWVAFQAPSAISSNITWTLPDADGSDGQVLATDGSGALTFTTVSTGANPATALAVDTDLGAMSGALDDTRDAFGIAIDNAVIDLDLSTEPANQLGTVDMGVLT